jgi:4-hydroxy-3-polyprenylbenzoate decarboxylase
MAITGASGSIYGIRLIEELLGSGVELHLCISGQSFPIIRHEAGIDFSGNDEAEIQKKVRSHFKSEMIFFHEEGNLAAPISSGSFRTEGMFVVPCSMKSLSGIAHGYAQNLIERAADVTLKERRRLILAPREMPLNSIHLENMLRLSQMGAVIAPPIPAFYQKPGTIEDVIDFVVGRLLDSGGVGNRLFDRWGDRDAHILDQS